jgi:hypothetical protein
MLSFAEDEGGLSLWLVNDHVYAVDGVLEYGCGSFSKATAEVLGRGNYVVPGNRSHRLLALPLSDLSSEAAADRFYWTRWLRNGELLSWQHHWLAPWGDVSLADPALKWEVSAGADGEHVLEISAQRYAWMVELGPADELDAEDNYFDLAPGQSRRVRLYGPARAVKQLTVRSWNDLLQKQP